MTVLIRADQAAAILNVSKPTLYAYVSRGRLDRTTAADGRTSLFARDEVERLAERSRRASSGPRPTIDVQIASAVTVMGEMKLEFRGHDVADLARSVHYEDVAELLWSDRASSVPSGTTWHRADPDDTRTLTQIHDIPASSIGRIAIAAHAFAAQHPDDGAAAAARRLLICTPPLLGSIRRTGPFARRLAGAWTRRPDDAFVHVVDTALMLLADHELATSTLAVRIAASVRAGPHEAYAAGLATMTGTLHGSASAHVHRFLTDCASSEPSLVIAATRAERRPIPGFGHKVYRGIDPRFGPLFDEIRHIDPDGGGVAMVEAVIAEVGRTLPHQPNVDLALGAFLWIAGLAPDTPLFAIARIAGWAAHYLEELDERPLRFRGIARPIP